MYDTAQEYNQKISGCVVLLNNVPRNVIEAFGSNKDDIRLLNKNLRTGTREEIPASDPGWDFRTVGSRLGYTNVDYGPESYRQALYTSRMAIRQSQSAQGLSMKNVRYDNLKPVPKYGLGSYKIPWGDLFAKPWFLDTLERRYPSYQDVTETMAKKQDVTSMAFSPKLAVFRPDVGPFYLEYRGKSVGYSDDMHRWKIGQDYEYLRETLDHLNIRVA